MNLDLVVDWISGPGLQIVLIAIGATLAARGARAAFGEMPGRLWPNDKHARSLAQALSWLTVSLVWIVAVFMVLQRIGIPLTTFVAPATVAGVAVGFGAQRIVADLLSGFFLFTERQLADGDLVRISQPGQTAGVTGTVEALTLRTTRLRTLSGEVVFVPNGEIRQLTNLSMDWGRIVLDVPITAGTDVDEALHILRSTAGEMHTDERWSEVLLGEPVATVESIDADNVTLRLLTRTRPGEQFAAAAELRRRVVERMRLEGLTTVGPLAAEASAADRS